MAEAKTAELVKYEPAKPVRTQGSLKQLLDQMGPSIRDILPRHLTLDRLLKTALLAVSRQPELLNCTQASVLQSVMTAGELGLDLSPTLGRAYLVPFKGQAVLIPGYRGLVQLARQSGEVQRVEAGAVYTKDEFEYERGVTLKLRHKPVLVGDRGELRGFYALLEYKDGSVQAEWMGKEEVDKIRNASQGRNSLMWKEHYDEGGKKTVLRRLMKLAPLSPDKENALEPALAAMDVEFPELPEGATPETPPVIPEKAESKGDAAARAARQARTAAAPPPPPKEAQEPEQPAEVVERPSASPAPAPGPPPAGLEFMIGGANKETLHQFCEQYGLDVGEFDWKVKTPIETIRGLVQQAYAEALAATESREIPIEPSRIETGASAPPDPAQQAELEKLAAERELYGWYMDEIQGAPDTETLEELRAKLADPDVCQEIGGEGHREILRKELRLRQLELAGPRDTQG